MPNAMAFSVSKQSEFLVFNIESDEITSILSSPRNIVVPAASKSNNLLRASLPPPPFGRSAGRYACKNVDAPAALQYILEQLETAGYSHLLANQDEQQRCAPSLPGHSRATQEALREHSRATHGTLTGHSGGHSGATQGPLRGALRPAKHGRRLR